MKHSPLIQNAPDARAPVAEAPPPHLNINICMAKFQQGIYTLNNPSKYVGKRTPRYRSGWELAVFRMCDAHPNVIAWGPKTHRIPQNFSHR